MLIRTKFIIAAFGLAIAVPSLSSASIAAIGPIASPVNSETVTPTKAENNSAKSWRSFRSPVRSFPVLSSRETEGESLLAGAVKHSMMYTTT